MRLQRLRGSGWFRRVHSFKLGNTSIRFRSIALGVITLFGFSAVGLVYLWGQQQTERALVQAKTYQELESLSQAISIQSSALETAQKNYENTPGDSLKQEFDSLFAEAGARLNELQSLPIADEYFLEIADVKDTLEGISGSFEMLHGYQKQIGFDADRGLQKVMSDSLGQAEASMLRKYRRSKDPNVLKLLATFSDLARAQLKFTLTGSPDDLGAFEVAYSRFTRNFQRAEIDAGLRDSVGAQMTAYQEAFGQFSELYEKRTTSSELLSNLFDLLPPRLADLKTAAELGAGEASDKLTRTTEQTNLYLAVAVSGTAGILFVLGASLIFSILRGLTALRVAMSLLAKDDVSADIPVDRGGREMAAMAKALQVFRDNIVERVRLREEQDKDTAQKQARAEMVSELIEGFEGTVADALQRLHEAADGLGQASSDVGCAADNVSSEADSAGRAVENAAENVASASAATEQLAMSIDQIAGQAEQSRSVANQAVEGSRATAETMQMLSSAAERIGVVVGLIRDIAGQTNLLALNATIEAARAGEHGKGFAVVASEVKTLANQTSQATEEIAQQVGAIQQASTDAVDAIRDVSRVIEEMSELASAVASSVEQQNAAVQAITENVTSATQSSRAGAEAMEQVESASVAARATGGTVSDLASALTLQADHINGTVGEFLEKVRAA